MALLHDSVLFGTLMGEGVSCVESLQLIRQDAIVEPSVPYHVSPLVSDARAVLGIRNTGYCMFLHV
jgi:hypothetical protein